MPVRAEPDGGADDGSTYVHTVAPVSPSSATTRSRLGTYITPPTTIGTAVELPPSWNVHDVSRFRDVARVDLGQRRIAIRGEVRLISGQSPGATPSLVGAAPLLAAVAGAGCCELFGPQAATLAAIAAIDHPTALHRFLPVHVQAAFWAAYDTPAWAPRSSSPRRVDAFAVPSRRRDRSRKRTVYVYSFGARRGSTMRERALAANLPS